jgi:hypothetical protein
MLSKKIYVYVIHHFDVYFTADAKKMDAGNAHVKSIHEAISSNLSNGDVKYSLNGIEN